MNAAAEVLALLDERIGLPGEHYPTLDDYTAALDELHRIEARAESQRAAAPALNLYRVPGGDWDWDRPPPRWFDAQAAAISVLPSTRHRLEAFLSGAWYPIGGERYTFSSVAEAEKYATLLRSVQPDITLRVTEVR